MRPVLELALFGAPLLRDYEISSCLNDRILEPTKFSPMSAILSGRRANCLPSLLTATTPLGGNNNGVSVRMAKQ
jgi:hypothetical protein